MVNTSLSIALILIGISFILIVIRFLLGPSILDRVVAFDVLTISSIGLIVLVAHFLNRAIYIDVSIVYAILSFIGVIIIAKYMEKSL